MRGLAVAIMMSIVHSTTLPSSESLQKIAKDDCWQYEDEIRVICLSQYGQVNLKDAMQDDSQADIDVVNLLDGHQSADDLDNHYIAFVAALGTVATISGLFVAS